MPSIRRWSVQAGWRAACVQQRPGGKPSVATVTGLQRKRLCIVTKETTVVMWGGRGGRMDGWEERKEKGEIRQKRQSKNNSMRWREGEGMMSRCLRCRDMSSGFIIPSISACLCWLILDCVGEFTVCCNLIPNKVTQQILLTQMDTAALLWEASSNRTQ